MEGNIVISKNEYCRLLENEAKLEMLERGGVDNWEFYGEALYPDGQDFDDVMSEIKKKVEIMQTKWEYKIDINEVVRLYGR
jgi:hypothetical protein